MSDQKRTLTITTRKSNDYKLRPAEGALGGITPTQMFQINFYTESPNIPEKITHELTEDGKLGRQINAEISGGEIVRELQAGIVMSMPQAENLAKWILQTLKNRTTAAAQPQTDTVM